MFNSGRNWRFRNCVSCWGLKDIEPMWVEEEVNKELCGYKESVSRLWVLKAHDRWAWCVLHEPQRKGAGEYFSERHLYLLSNLHIWNYSFHSYISRFKNSHEPGVTKCSVRDPAQGLHMRMLGNPLLLSHDTKPGRWYGIGVTEMKHTPSAKQTSISLPLSLR